MNALSEMQRKGPLLELGERVAPEHTALVVIDVQNDFCHPEGVFGALGHDLSGMAPMADRLSRLIGAARESGVLVFFVKVNEDAKYIGPPVAESYHRRGFLDSMCLEGSWGAQWYAPVEPRAGERERELLKHRFSAFGGTSLDLYLRSNAVRTVVVTGVVTSGCVEDSVRDAFFLDYHVVVASDCVAEASEERHGASLRKMAQAFGTVTEAGEIIEAWRRVNAPPARARPPALSLEEALRPAETALLLLELQNDVCAERGALNEAGPEPASIRAGLVALARLLEASRGAGVMVIHVRHSRDPLGVSPVRETLDALAGTSRACLPGTWGHRFVAGFEPRPGEIVIDKSRVSAFADTRLAVVLRANAIRTAIVAGARTHAAVEATAREAADRDFLAVVPRDAVFAETGAEELHEAALSILASGASVLSDTQSIRAAWSSTEQR